MNVFDIIVNYHSAFAKGIFVTLQLCAIIWSSGILIGAILGVTGAKFHLSIGIPSQIFSFTLSGVPILVFLFWLHYPAQSMLGIVVDPFYTAALTLSIVNIFAVADIVRTALRDFPGEYIAAAKVTGLSQTQTMFKIQLPLIIRSILPSLILLQVTMLHTTLFASLISVDEIFRTTQRINAQIYRPVEIYTALGLFFLLISLPINGFALLLRRKYTRDVSQN